jgi:hypothetical protein
MKPTLKQILIAVAAHYGVSTQFLHRDYSNVRRHNGRGVFCYICVDMYSYDFSQVGRHIGYSEHTAVMHIVDKIRKTDDPHIKKDITLILNNLKPSPEGVSRTASEVKIREQQKLMNDVVAAYKNHQDLYGSSTHTERRALQAFNDAMQKMSVVCDGL